MKTLKLSRVSSALVLALGVSSGAFATETASSVRGKILDPQGNPAANTTITIKNPMTGASKTVVTNASGAFVANGLRVGGPYTIVVDSDKYKDQEIENVYLQVGQPYRANVQLQEEQIERISVSGSRHAMMTSQTNGVGSSYGAEAIAMAPSFDRDLKDILRNDPLVNIDDDGNAEMSVAGANPRYNSLTVDGVRQDDDFGLNDNGYPTQRSPISLLSVGQVSVSTAAYTARSAGYSGGGVNAVTKSGTNDFEAELFYEYASDSLAGDQTNDEGNDVEFDFERKTMGASFSGPIIEDELFFHVSYEKYSSPFVNEFGVAGSGAANEALITQAHVDQIVNIARDVYGVDAGIAGATPDEKDEKLLIKLDWDVNDQHRAAFTYQLTDGNSARPQGTFGNGSGAELGLSSHWYLKSEKLSVFSAHLYSDWTDNFSSEFKVGFKSVETGQDPMLGKHMGDVRIDVRDSEGDRIGRVSIGPDVFRHGNELSNDLMQMRFVGEYLYEDHAISFGVEYEDLEIRNLFAPWSMGEWRFGSIEDFANRNASSFSYSNAYTGNVEDAAAKFSFTNLNLFVEDKFEVNDDLWVNAGLRYERVGTDAEPTFNQNFMDRYGFANTENLDGDSLILPRISFNWLADDNLTIRGGIGRFSGGKPNVWISNAFSNDGVTYVRANTRDVDRSNADITMIPAGVTLESGDGNVNSIDPNFELPRDTRMSLAADYTADLGALGDNWFLSAEYMYVKTDKDIGWKDLYRENPDDPAQNPTTGPDGRTVYHLGSRDRDDVMFTNFDGGRSKIFTLKANKSWDNGVRVGMSYANQDVTNIVPGTSSTASSNYAKYATADRNNPVEGVSRYQIEHAFKFNVSYTTEIWDGYESRFSFFGSRTSGRPYSWVYNNGVDIMGDQGAYDDGNEDLYLPYLPTGADDPRVMYADGFSYDQLASVMAANGLNGYAGSILPRNVGKGPWVSRLDFKFEQEIPGLFDGHKGSFYFDIKNVLNLIDSSAGRVYKTSWFNGRTLTDVGYNADTHQWVYSGGTDLEPPTDFRALESTWRMKMGISYKF